MKDRRALKWLNKDLNLMLRSEKIEKSINNLLKELWSVWLKLFER